MAWYGMANPGLDNPLAWHGPGNPGTDGIWHGMDWKILARMAFGMARTGKSLARIAFGTARTGKYVLRACFGRPRPCPRALDRNLLQSGGVENSYGLMAAHFMTFCIIPLYR